MRQIPNALLPLVLAGLLVLCACSADRSIEFRLRSLGGELLSPEDFAGKVLLLDFWATWCVPCRAQAMTLESLYPEYEGSDVEFLAVNVGEEEALVRRFVRDRPFGYPALLDPDDTLGSRLGVELLPTIVVLDRSRRVVYSRPGLSTARDLRRALNRAIASSGP